VDVRKRHRVKTIKWYIEREREINKVRERDTAEDESKRKKNRGKR
jgi:hypothetical protein